MSETEITARLERLERNNKRFKRLATVALVIAAAFCAIYAARPVPDKITAHEFDVVDGAGTVRAKLDNYRLWLFDSNGRPTIALTSASNGAGIEFYGTETQKIGQVELPVDRMQLTTWGLSFNDTHGRLVIGLGGISPAKTSDLPLPDLTLAGTSPHISLSGSKGYSMDLGTSDLVMPTTGETHQTSAASIVMFGNDKDHHVIWRAP